MASAEKTRQQYKIYCPLEPLRGAAAEGVCVCVCTFWTRFWFTAKGSSGVRCVTVVIPDDRLFQFIPTRYCTGMVLPDTGIGVGGFGTVCFFLWPASIVQP
jgi:hypothetical protein